MTEGEFVDWGNPIAEMMYEGLRYFAGKGSDRRLPLYSNSGSVDDEVGLSAAPNWDNPFDKSASAAKAEPCAKCNFLVVSDINPSFDSDKVPGAYSEFGSLSGGMADRTMQRHWRTSSAPERASLTSPFSSANPELTWISHQLPRLSAHLERSEG